MALTFYGWDTSYDNKHHLLSDQESMDGREYIMYHGASVSSARSIIQSGFRQSSQGMLGPGIYVSRDKEKARRYPLKTPNDRVILMLKVRVGKVKKIDKDNHPMSKTWNQQEYDTAWVPPNCGMKNVPSGLEEDCVWDPQRIWVIDVISPRSPQPLSYITPQDGKVYVMYHGTSKQNVNSICNPRIGFQRSKDGMLGPGVYVSRDFQKASKYPLFLDENQKAVLKLKVNVGRVKKIDHQGHPLQKTWQRHGYDTAWCPPDCGMVPSGLEEDCVWDPKRIKVVEVMNPSRCSNPRGNSDCQRWAGYSAAGASQPSQILPSSDLHGRKCFSSGVKAETAADFFFVQPRGAKDNCSTSTVKFTIAFTSDPLFSNFCIILFPTRSSFQVHLFIMAYEYGSMWAEEDAPGFTAPCLQSYVTPQEGMTYEMYHGTSKESLKSICNPRIGLQQSKDGMLGPGVYVSRDFQKASIYPKGLHQSQKAVLRLRVNVGKVKKIDHQGHPLQKTWHWHGYDTAWCPPDCGMVPSGLEEDCVWDPSRITIVEVMYPAHGSNPRGNSDWS
uniref:grass carp reovirus (GCRV)-induced gene 2e n=1 Tax=Pristiophorus japonicus TaxID=55135 RepID=UPI00398EC87E